RMNTNKHEFIERPSIRVDSPAAPKRSKAGVNSWLIYLGWPKKRRVEDRPEMDDPPEQDKPEDCRQTKLDDRHQQSSLEQLPQAGDEETAECGENVTR